MPTGYSLVIAILLMSTWHIPEVFDYAFTHSQDNVREYSYDQSEPYGCQFKIIHVSISVSTKGDY